MGAVAGFPLSQLAIGQEGVVAQLGLSGPARQRLLALGLVLGAPVRVVRVAPLGDPLALQVRGSQFSLRKVIARQILVETAPPAGAGDQGDA